MRITMLGVSGAGKTCYMSAMSQLFYNGVVNGFHLRDIEGSSNGYFNHRAFDQINTIVSNYQWPDGTATSTMMQLELECYGNHVVNIDWIDYKGKLVHDIDKGIDHKQDGEAAALEAVLLTSDVILVFIDAIILKNENNVHRIKNLTGANEIGRILTQVKRIKCNSNIIFLLSKVGSDLINFDRDYRKLLLKAKEAYEVFFYQMNREADLCKFIPVDCLGFNKVNTRISGTNSFKEYSPRIIADMDPYNIDVSFAYALSKCIENESLDKQLESIRISKRIEELETKFGSIKQLLDIIFHHSERRIELAKSRLNYRRCQSDIGELNKYEKELYTIWKGKI